MPARAHSHVLEGVVRCSMWFPEPADAGDNGLFALGGVSEGQKAIGRWPLGSCWVRTPGVKNSRKKHAKSTRFFDQPDLSKTLNYLRRGKYRIFSFFVSSPTKSPRRGRRAHPQCRAPEPLPLIGGSSRQPEASSPKKAMFSRNCHRGLP